MHYHKERISCRGIKGHKNRTWTGTVGRGFSRSQRYNAKGSASRRCHCQCLRTPLSSPLLLYLPPFDAATIAFNCASARHFSRRCNLPLFSPSLPLHHRCSPDAIASTATASAAIAVVDFTSIASARHKSLPLSPPPPSLLSPPVFDCCHFDI